MIKDYDINTKPTHSRQILKWIEKDRKTALRMGDLIRNIPRDPFTGIGKPELLKHQFAGYWSRRIDQEHRLIYKITETSVVIFSFYSHYQK